MAHPPALLRPDPLDSAIAAEAAPKPVTMTVLEGAFGDSGRPFGISVPADLSEAEAYALVELITKIRQQAFAKETQRPRLFVPS